MVGRHHRLSGHEFEQALGDGDGRGGLARCSPRGCKESDRTERLNNNNLNTKHIRKEACFMLPYCKNTHKYIITSVL